MNKILFKIHGTLALFAVVPLLVICLTGSILVFKHEIDWLLIGDKVRVDKMLVGNDRLELDTLLSHVNDAAPDYEAVGWVWFLDKARSDIIYLVEKGTSDWSYLLLNQYTGDILAAPQPLDHFFTDWLLELHVNFLLHDAGLAVTSLFAVALLALGITGLILYRGFWKRFFTLRWNSRLIFYFSDLHKMTGVIASPVLVIVAFTGIWWNVTSLLHEIDEHSDGKEHHVMQERLYNDALSLDALQAAARSEIQGFEATYLTMPYEPGVNFDFYGKVPTGNFLLSQYSSMVSYDAQTGEHLSTFDIRQAGLGAKIVDSYRRLHFGDFAGLASRILWAILGLAPALLAVTGITLWAKRRSMRKRSRDKRKARFKAVSDTDKLVSPG